MTKYLKLVIVAAVATAIVTGYNYVFGPILGLPTFQRTRFIASVFNTGLLQGWFINLFIGVLLTLLYVKLFRRAFSKINFFMSGLTFGLFIFIILQFFYALFANNLPNPADYLQSADFMKKFILNSLVANLIFGLIVGIAMGKQRSVERD